MYATLRRPWLKARMHNFLRRLHIADLICKLCFRNCLHDRAKQYHTLRKIIIHILLQNIVS